MIFTKKAKQKLVCLLAAASLSLPNFCITGMAISRDIDCSDVLADSGAYALEDIGETAGSEFTLEEFKGKLEAAENLGRTAICTFEDFLNNPTLKDKNTWIDTLNLKYGENGEKTLAVTQKAEFEETHESSYYSKGFRIVSGSLAAGYASSGINFVSMLYKGENNGKVWTYAFSPSVNGDNVEIVKAVGFISTRKNVGVKITVHYANLSDGNPPEGTPSKTITVNEDENAKGEFCTFVGFEAPQDCYITKLVFESAGSTMGLDDLSLITQAVSAETAEPKRIELDAPDTIQTPCYDSTLEYDCTAKVFDQFGLELDRDVEITVDNNDVAEIKDGKLIIKQMTDMPTTITLSVSTDGIATKTHVITVDTSVSPYYDVSKIGVDAFEAYDEEKYGEYTEKTDCTLEEFIAAMETAAATDGMDVSMINFESENEELYSDRIRVPLLKDKEKLFDFVFATRYIVIEKVDAQNRIDTEKNLSSALPKKVLPPSGKKYLNVVPAVTAENDYVFDTSMLGDLRVTSFGLVYVPKGANTNIVSDGFGIHATFSDGTQKIYGTDQIKGGTGVKEENTFYGIKAPAGHYITRIVITTQPRSWNGADSFGFIFEKPDILTLKPDFEKLTFSSFCDQNMENITDNIVLPTVTDGGCTIDWTAKMADNTLSDVIATDETDSANLGKLTVPDVPEKSNVRLGAAVSYGALTFLRNFDLYVPSKLERDFNKIGIPEKTKENKITLPSVGSEYGSTITWESLNPELIDNDGNVTRPDGMLDKYCAFQVTLTNPSGTLVKEIGVTVEGTGHDTSTNEGTGSTTGIVATGPGGGGGGGGGGAATKPPVPVEVKPPVEETTPSNNTFTDVPKEHWAYESIVELTQKGIVNGMGENSFKPEGTVTREQYLSMLVRAFDFADEDAAAEFSDVEKDSWYFDAVSVAQALGICGGYEDGSFGIGKEITREEMAVMAYRCALLAGLSVESSDENIAWKDSGEISHFAYDAVAALNNAGIIKGISEEKFSPKATTTRAQAAVIIQRLLSAQ